MKGIKNPFAELIGTTESRSDTKLQPSDWSWNREKTTDSRQGADQLPILANKENAGGANVQGSEPTSKKELNSLEEVAQLAKKIEVLTGSKVVLEQAQREEGQEKVERIGKQEKLNVRPLNDRFSVGGMAPSWKHGRMSSVGVGRRMSSIGVGRSSLDMRDFDLDEVKRHRMSLLVMPLSSRDDSPPFLPSSASTEDSVSVVTKSSASGADCTLLEFCSVGVDREILSGKIMPCWDTRRQKVRVLDVFPTSSPLIEDIADYCFPGGASLEVLTQEEAGRMNCRSRDSLHVLHFSDANGKPTYATVLTTVEVLPANFTKNAIGVLHGDLDTENGNLVAYLLILRKRIRAATTIQRFFAMRTKGLRFTKPREYRMGSVVVEAMRREKERKTVPQALFDSAKHGISVSVPALESSSSSTYSMAGMWDRWMQSRSASVEESIADDTADDGGDTEKAAAGKFESGGLYEFFEDEDEESTVMTTTSSNESLRYRTRTESSIPEEAAANTTTAGAHTDMNKYYVVTERAFCVLHDRPHHGAMVKILRAIAAKEGLRIAVPVKGADGAGDDSPRSTSGSVAVDREDEVRVRARIIATANMVAAGQTNSATTTTDAADSERTRSISSCSALSTASFAGLEHSPPAAIDLSSTLSCDLMYAARAARRCAFLSYVQSLPLRRMPSVKVSFPAYCPRTFHVSGSDSSASIHPTRKKMGESLGSTSMGFNQAHLHEAEAWMTATVFSLLPAEVVVQVLSVLLMERSVVLHSSDAGLVTTISTALLALMAPFRWAGAFVPLLPLNCTEIMQAPVPFLVGTTRAPHLLRDVSPEAAVLFIDDYLQSSMAYFEGVAGADSGSGALRRKKRYLFVPKGRQTLGTNGDHVLSNITATGGTGGSTTSSSCGEEGYVDLALASDPSMTSGGQRLCARIRALSEQLRVGDKDSSCGESVLSVAAATLQMTAFCMGMTPAERDAVVSLRLVVRAYAREILGDLVSPEDDLETQLAARRGKFQHDDLHEGYTWARYGVLSTTDEEDFTFYPEWYLDQHRHKLQFLSAACASQYFLTFVDELHLRDIRRRKCRILLRDWMRFRMHLRQKHADKKK